MTFQAFPLRQMIKITDFAFGVHLFPQSTYRIDKDSMSCTIYFKVLPKRRQLNEAGGSHPSESVAFYLLCAKEGERASERETNGLVKRVFVGSRHANNGERRQGDAQW